MKATLLLLPFLSLAAATRDVWVTDSIGHTPPPFPCAPDTTTHFSPHGANATVTEHNGMCAWSGTTVPGDYVASTPDSAVFTVTQAIATPVRNVGGATLFQDSFQSARASDSDVWFDAWAVPPSPCTVSHGAAGGLLLAGSKCGLTSNPYPGRLFNFFRTPTVVAVRNVTVSGGATFELGFQGPSQDSLAHTGFKPPRHYLWAAAAVDPSCPHGAITLRVSSSSLSLAVAATPCGPTSTLVSEPVPAACTLVSTTVSFSVSSILASASLTCGNGQSVTLAPTPHNLDFITGPGFADSAAEAVLRLGVTSGTCSVGDVAVSNAAPEHVLPAALAPISDQSGTHLADIGVMGSFHSKSSPPWGPEEGVLDPTAPPFHADKTGNADATEALSAALRFARANYLAVYLPVGTYIVTDSLNLTQYTRMRSNGAVGFNSSSNYCNRFAAFALRGQVLRADGSGGDWDGSPRPGRATLVVPPNTPAFSGAFPQKAVVNASNVNRHGELQPNINMANVLQSLDVIIGAGNPAAVGVRMRGAQGTGIEDVAVFAAPDAWGGVSACSGSGGAHANITVVGGRFGLDCRESQPGSGVVNLRLANQSCAALLVTGIDGLSIAGAHLTVGSGAFAAVGGGYHREGFPALDGACKDANQFPFPLPQVPTPNSNNGFLSLTNATLECVPGSKPGGALVATTRGVHMADVYVRGCAGGQVLVDLFDQHAKDKVVFTAGVPSSGHQALMALGVPTYEGQVKPTALVNGTAVPATVPLFNDAGPAAAAPHPDTLCDWYSWGDNAAFPGHWSAAATSVKADHQAVGDGVADDTAALAAALASGSTVVFLPQGTYRVSKPLVVPAGVSVVGVARFLTTITADVDAFRGQAPTPLITFESGAAARPAGVLHATLAALQITLPLLSSNATAWQWAAGAPTFNAMRQVWQTRVPVCGQWWSTQCAQRWALSNSAPYGGALTHIKGSAATLRVFQFYNEDGPRNGGGVGNGQHRKLLVEDTLSQVMILQLNGEHGSAGAYTEFRNTSGVRVHGCKSEDGSAGSVYWVRDSTDFVSTSHGGLAGPPAEYPPGFPAFFPTQFRFSGDISGIRCASLARMKGNHGSMVGEFTPDGNVTSAPETFPVMYVRD